MIVMHCDASWYWIEWNRWHDNLNRIVSWNQCWFKPLFSMWLNCIFWYLMNKLSVFVLKYLLIQITGLWEITLNALQKATTVREMKTKKNEKKMMIMHSIISTFQRMVMNNPCCQIWPHSDYTYKLTYTVKWKGGICMNNMKRERENMENN